MKYLFILNPKSGPISRADKLIKWIDKIFSSSDHDYEFALTTGPGDATQIAANGTAGGFDIVAAVGGDGTVNEVASGLINSDTAMGIIPLGSGNGVARSLGLPVDVKKSIQLLLNANVITIDTGLINDLPFVGVAGLGYDANVGAKFQEFGHRGPVPYFIIGVKEFLKYEPVQVSLDLENESGLFSPLLVAIANTKQYGNGAIIAPGASPTDGYLNVCVIKSVSLTRAIKLMQKLFNGSINEAVEYKQYKIKQIKINTSTDQTCIHTDGEPKTVTGDLDIRIKEKSLRVCVGS
jgi:diacylglycerol kinase (ATP)